MKRDASPYHTVKCCQQYADFAPGAATRQDGRTIRIVFDFGLLTPLYINTCHYPPNRKYATYYTAIRGGPSHGHR